MSISIFNVVIPMKMGIQRTGDWIPAFAGMTDSVLTENSQLEEVLR